MKRFLVFAGDNYYPLGGFDDLQGDYETLEAAQFAAEALNREWAQVADTQTGEYLSWERDGYPARPGKVWRE